MTRQVKEISAALLLGLVLLVVGIGIRNGVDVTDTQEQVAKLIAGAGILLVLVSLVGGAVALLRSR